MQRIRRFAHGYAGITATVALVLALGMGGAYAANKISSKQIKASAVKSKHIKDGQVKTTDLAPNVEVASAQRAGSARTADTATSAESAKRADTAATVGPNGVDSGAIADGSVAAAELASSAVTGEKIATGAVGSSDIGDDQITSADLGNGQVRAADLGPVNLRSNAVDVPASSTSNPVIAQCAANEVLLGGGAVFDGAQAGKFLHGSFPSGNTWVAYGRNSSTATSTFRVYVVCLGG